MTAGNGSGTVADVQDVPVAVVVQVIQRQNGLISVNIQAARPVSGAEVIGMLQIASQTLAASGAEPTHRPQIAVVRGRIPMRG